MGNDDYQVIITPDGSTDVKDLKKSTSDFSCYSNAPERNKDAKENKKPEAKR